MGFITWNLPTYAEFTTCLAFMSAIIIPEDCTKNKTSCPPWKSVKKINGYMNSLTSLPKQNASCSILAWTHSHFVCCCLQLSANVSNTIIAFDLHMPPPCTSQMVSGVAESQILTPTCCSNHMQLIIKCYVLACHLCNISMWCIAMKYHWWWQKKHNQHVTCVLTIQKRT